MTVIINAVIHAILNANETDVDVQALKVVAIFCRVGLAASLIVATYGVDSAGAFSRGDSRKVRQAINWNGFTS
jgi:hypothetical protein